MESKAKMLRVGDAYIDIKKVSLVRFDAKRVTVLIDNNEVTIRNSMALDEDYCINEIVAELIANFDEYSDKYKITEINFDDIEFNVYNSLERLKRTLKIRLVEDKESDEALTMNDISRELGNSSDYYEVKRLKKMASILNKEIINALIAMSLDNK